MEIQSEVVSCTKCLFSCNRFLLLLTSCSTTSTVVVCYSSILLYMRVLFAAAATDKLLLQFKRFCNILNIYYL